MQTVRTHAVNPSDASCLSGWKLCPKEYFPFGDMILGRSLRARSESFSCQELCSNTAGPERNGASNAAVDVPVVHPADVVLIDLHDVASDFPSQLDAMFDVCQSQLKYHLGELASGLRAAHHKCMADFLQHSEHCRSVGIGDERSDVPLQNGLSSSTHSTMEVSDVNEALPVYMRSVTWEDMRRRSVANEVGATASGKSPDAVGDSADDQVKGTCCSRNIAKQIVDHQAFTPLVCAAICSNAVIVGVESNYRAWKPSSSTLGQFQLIESVYTFIFTAEILIRICAFGPRQFFCDKSDRAWNFFDMFIVAASIIDMFASSVTSTNISHMRVIRTLRVTRVVRSIRLVRAVRYISALRSLLYSVVATFRTLAWALLLLVGLFYTFGITFTDAASYYREDSADVPVDMLLWWGDLLTSMLTLFKSVTGGISWHEPATPLGRISQFWAWVFCFFIAFTFLAVLNVITATFCQNAFESAQQDKDIATCKSLANQKQYSDKLRALFTEIDSDHSDHITIQEFEDMLEKEDCKAYFEALEIDSTDAWLLFELLDVDESGQIEIDEFVSGCMHLKGQAKAIQFAKMERENRLARRTMEAFILKVDQHLNELRGHLNVRRSGDVLLEPRLHGPNSSCQRQ